MTSDSNLMTQELATIPNQSPSALSLIEGVLKSEMTSDTVSVVERLVALKEREDKANAERAFARAFVQLQTETPKIQAQKIVPGNTEGSVRYKFAPYEDIMRAVRPLLSAHGFAITYDQSIADKSVTVTCTLMHTEGHSRSNTFTCRIGAGPPKASEAQGDGAATTYAKRFALCAALGITIEQDDSDGRDEGDGTTITREQAADLRLRCEETTTDMQKFCAWLGVTSFDDIKAKDWQRADAKLKERAKK